MALKKILYFVVLICLCAWLLKLGGYSWESFKHDVHLRDPGTVLSPITDNAPKGHDIIGDIPNSGGGGYTFDPNLRLDGSSSSTTVANNSETPEVQTNSDGSVIENPSSNNNENNSTGNGDSSTEDTKNNSSEDSNNSSEESTDTSIVDDTSKESKESTTEKKETISSKVYHFIIDGKEKVLTSENTASFIQWLEKNFKDGSNVSYNTDGQAQNSSNLDLDSLIAEVPRTDKLVDTKDYDRTAFESPAVTYTLDGKKVNRNDYAWKTSPYFNESDYTYTCPYTGKVIKDSDDKKDDKDFGNLDYDHIVPLKSAYLRGAKDWTEEQKNAYAYDQFVGVDVLNSANRSKADKGPAEWLPDVNRGSYCYSWLVICQKYSLSMTQEEIDICNSEINKAIANGEKVEFMGGSYNN